MNRQGKNGIEWCDYTWNPVTGCLHGCEYCYARRQVNRFKGWTDDEGETHYDLILKPETQLRELSKPLYIAPKEKIGKWPKAPYPFGFNPTFHRYRLDEPQKIKKPQKIFACSMADLFGDWVPDEWIGEVFKACEAAPWHKYLFLTKNPYRYLRLHIQGELPQYSNFWYGTTLTGQGKLPFNCLDFKQNFISLEPLLEGVSDKFPFTNIHWVIIGQQTGPGAIPPKSEWVQSIIDQCREAGVPVFVKRPLYEQFPIQEWPEGLKEVKHNAIKENSIL
jgi:protein gp37